MTQKQTLADKAYFTLKRAITNNEFAAGEKLNISELKARYAIGNCPLREGLARLASAGLIISEPMKGYRIPVISFAEAEDIYRARKLIDETILKLAMEQASDDWEASVVATHHQLKKIELAPKDDKSFAIWQERHHQFMAALFSEACSPTLFRLHHMLYDQSERYRCIWFEWGVVHNSQTFEQFAAYHQRFVDAVTTRNTQALLDAYAEKLVAWLAEAKKALIAQGFS